MQTPHAAETTVQPMHPLAGRVLNGRYQILSFAGTGGMASVYRARDLVLGRTVAVKVLHSRFGGNEEFVARFQREAEFAAGLSGHPNIVSIFDVGADGDLRYIVMEVIEGEDLAAVIETEAPLPVNRALTIAEEIAVALAFAHRHGLVHRDIKPQNILLLPDGRVKVTDFGIAWNGESTPMTQAGVVLGTTHYLSPEQALGRPPGPRSDIYALGVVLYQMLTGRVPFDGEDRFDVAMKHVSEPIVPAERVNAAVPAHVGAIVARALSKDPEQRFPTAEEMAEALRSAQRDVDSEQSSGRRRAVRVRPAVQSATAVMTAPLFTAARRHADRPGTIAPRVLGGACLLAILAAIGLAVAERSPLHSAAPRPSARVKGVSLHARPTPPVAGCTGHDAAKISLLDATVAPTVVAAGQTVTISYTVQNRSAGCIPLYLRATARNADVPGQSVDDPLDSRVVSVQPGTHQFQRRLRFPPTNAVGVSQSFAIDAGISVFDGPRPPHADRTLAYAVTVTPA